MGTQVLRMMGMEVPSYAQCYLSDEYHAWLEQTQLPCIKRGHIYRLLQEARHVEVRTRVMNNEEIVTVTMVIRR